MTGTYTKLIKARYSPQNGCYAPNGDVLYVEPRQEVPITQSVAHHFRSTSNSSLTAKFGWVAEESPFSLDEFISRHLAPRAISDSQRSVLDIMLASVARLRTEKAVAASYSRRGVEQRRMELTVHPVVFYVEGDSGIR
jgi:hypothetical protein